MTRRWIYRFESLANESLYYDFPGYMYEWEGAQELRLANEPVVGAHYSHDFLGEFAAPIEDAEETIHFLIANGAVMTDAQLDTALDSIMSLFLRIGKGKLWTIGADSSKRWAEARATGMPSVVTGVEYVNHIPVECNFLRSGFWKAENPVTGSVNLNAASQDFTIVNSGQIRTDYITFRLRSNGATGFTNPKLTNTLLGQSFQTTRDAVSANSELRIRPWLYSFEWSDDNGATYTADYDKVTIPATQVPFMELEPGDNLMRYENTGTPDSVLEWEYYPQYAS